MNESYIKLLELLSFEQSLERGEMREKVERGERIGSQQRKGFVHKLDQSTASYYFTNFPEDAKVNVLWSKFARYGRVGEVYVPKKLDKQGKRFRFVKFREVRNTEELLSRLGDVWLGSFKLRVNLSRFNRDDRKREEPADVPESSAEVEARTQAGRLFKAALVDRAKKGDETAAERCNGEKQNPNEVVWEVEVETEVMAKLKGAYVGFLTTHKEAQAIQQNFILDGYQNIKVAPLGYLKVLISSFVAGEVAEVVSTVGWWCTWFDRFEEWSPNLVSNQRSIWVRCFGVPLHAWGIALFRSLAFKFGYFVEVDEPTKNFQRCDMARIRIGSSQQNLIDAKMVVAVLGKRFEIKVLEEIGGSGDDGVRNRCGCMGYNEPASSRGSVDGGSVLTVADSVVESGSDESWSKGEDDHVMLGVGREEVGQRRVEDVKGKGAQEVNVSDLNSNLLGNSSDKRNVKVNDALGEGSGECQKSVGVGEKSNRGVGGGSDKVGDVTCRSDDLAGVGGVLVGSGQDEGYRSDGLIEYGPRILRTKQRDIPFIGPVDQRRLGSSQRRGGWSSVKVVSQDKIVGCIRPISTVGGPSRSSEREVGKGVLEFSSLADRGRKRKVKKNHLPFRHANKFQHFKYFFRRTGGEVRRRKIRRCDERMGSRESSNESDPIVSSSVVVESENANIISASNAQEFELEVVTTTF
jgi:hypothetical protein